MNEIANSEELLKLETNLVELLKKKYLTITTAESCTAGLVAASIVNVSGASEVFKEGYITYCDDAKSKLLNVKKSILEKYTAVSKETAIEMAVGGAKAANADVCISVTGVAGPGNENGKPVGLVYVGCYYNGMTKVNEYHFRGERQHIRMLAVKNALDFTLKVISDK